LRKHRTVGLSEGNANIDVHINIADAESPTYLLMINEGKLNGSNKNFIDNEN